MKEMQPKTKYSSNTGLNGTSNILPHLSFSLGSQVSSLQSHTAAPLKQWQQFDNTY